MNKNETKKRKNTRKEKCIAENFQLRNGENRKIDLLMTYMSQADYFSLFLFNDNIQAVADILSLYLSIIFISRAHLLMFGFDPKYKKKSHEISAMPKIPLLVFEWKKEKKKNNINGGKFGWKFANIMLFCLFFMSNLCVWTSVYVLCEYFSFINQLHVHQLHLNAIFSCIRWLH